MSNIVGLNTLVYAAKTFNKVTSPENGATKKPKEEPYSVWEDIFMPLGYSHQDIKLKMKSTYIEVETKEVGVFTSEFSSPLFLQAELDKWKAVEISYQGGMVPLKQQRQIVQNMEMKREYELTLYIMEKEQWGEDKKNIRDA
jgi:hypothetical protein